MDSISYLSFTYEIEGDHDKINLINKVDYKNLINQIQDDDNINITKNIKINEENNLDYYKKNFIEFKEQNYQNKEINDIKIENKIDDNNIINDINLNDNIINTNIKIDNILNENIN